MNTAKKLAVLEGLRAQSEPLGLPELMALLPPGFAERSVRRWLSELEDEGQVARSGRRRGTRYRALAALSPESPAAGKGGATGSMPPTPGPMRFSQTAQTAAAYVSQPLFQRAPLTYDPDWLAAYEPNRSAYFPPGQSAELAAAGRRAPVGDPAGTYAKRIYDRLLIDLSHHSSRLEGRQQRRAAVGGIVADVAFGDALAERIRTAAAKVPAEERQAFIEDLEEDLEALSSARIAGLGISQRQLRIWLKARDEAKAVR